MIYKLSLLAFLITTASMVAMVKDCMLLDDLDTSNLTLSIPSSQVRTQNVEDKVELFWDNEGFIVKKGELCKRVNSYDTDKLFRNFDLKNMAKYTLLMNKFKVIELSNGDFKVQPNLGLLGGGIAGANVGFFAGKFLVHFVAHSTIAVISICTGPAAGPTALALEATFIPFIESASNIAAIGTGILVAVITGPV